MQKSKPTTNLITNFIAITNFIPPGNEPQVQKYWKAKEGNATVELFASLCWRVLSLLLTFLPYWSLGCVVLYLFLSSAVLRFFLVYFY